LRTLLAALFPAALFVACFMPLSCLAAAKTTVSELDKLLASLNDQHKPDEAVATRLKEVELTEQLTPLAINKLMQYKTSR
jgi:hypothetical protein